MGGFLKFRLTDNDKNSAMKKAGNFRMLLRNLRKQKEQETNKQALDLSNVSASLLSETIYLLRKNQPNNCPDWVEGIGDCKQDSCEFCRTEKCIDALESNVR